MLSKWLKLSSVLAAHTRGFRTACPAQGIFPESH